MKDYIRLIRIKHYIKNGLVFAALLFSGQLTDTVKLVDCILAFFAF